MRAARVGMPERACFHEFEMCSFKHVAQPRRLRECGAQTLAHVAFIDAFFKARAHFRSVAADPFGFAALHREDERAANAVVERLRVIVRRIRDAFAGVVLHEGNLFAVGAKRRAR